MLLVIDVTYEVIIRSNYSGTSIGVNLGCGCGLHDGRGGSLLKPFHFPLGPGNCINCIHMNWESFETYPRKDIIKGIAGFLSLFFLDALHEI